MRVGTARWAGGGRRGERVHARQHDLEADVRAPVGGEPLIELGQAPFERVGFVPVGNRRRGERLHARQVQGFR